MNTPARPDALLRLQQVLSIIPVSRTGWLAGVKSGRFPEPVRISARVIAWRASDIANIVAGGQPGRKD